MEFLRSRAAARFVRASMLASTLGGACIDAAGTRATSPARRVGVADDTTTKQTPTPMPLPLDTATKTTPGDGSAQTVLVGARLYVDPMSSARLTADAWRTSRPTDAAQLDKIAAQPQAQWFTERTPDITATVSSAATTIVSTGAVPVFVAYNIPQRDCGGLSGGNDVGIDQYKRWITDFAAGIGGRRAVVILEPDALANMDCLSAADQATRISLLAYAVAKFKALGATVVYIDAGHAKWQTAATMALRLRAAGVADAAGFSLNVSNFVTDADNIAYGRELAASLNGKHFVIDSSRNGLGPTADGRWCNPSGRALGTRPTTITGIAGLDAFLWIKPPGESDGACDGGPDAGAWWPEYALGLAQRAAY